MNDWNKIYHANQKKARVTILFSDSTDFKARNVLGDKEGHSIMIRRSVLQEDMMVLDVYGRRNRASKYNLQLQFSQKPT